MSRTLSTYQRVVRRPRRCSGGHQLDRGDFVRGWVGIIEGQFEVHETCMTCDYGPPSTDEEMAAGSLEQTDEEREAMRKYAPEWADT
jgi:hypothetical protein